MFDKEKILRIRDEHLERGILRKIIAEANQILTEMGVSDKYSFVCSMSTSVHIHAPCSSKLYGGIILFMGKTWRIANAEGHYDAMNFADLSSAMQGTLEIIAAEVGDE